jgi:glycosyltransferase involved in cell wall biosynthesis
MDACLQRAFPGSLHISERAWLKKQKPDLVVISQGGPWDGVAWMLTCRELGLPYCGIVQSNSELWWPGNGDFDEIQQAISSAQRIFFVSHANHLLMEKQCAMRLPNAEVIFNPWNVPSDAVPAWPGDVGETHLACVARLEPRAKGQDILLEVFASPKWKARPIRLNLYGSGPGEKPLHALKSFYKLDRVFFHGQVSDVSAIWAANHGLILPSRYEGLPLAMVEAMLSARPVIATDVAGNTELVREGINGFVAEAPTPALLDHALERAWSRRKEWREIGLKARTDTLKLVPLDPIAEFVEKLLNVVRTPKVPA